MNFNRNEHSRFVRWLDRTAEKNPLLWLPCVILIALALAVEHIAEYIKIAYSHRNTEKIVKKKPQLEKKPFALRTVAMSLVMALSFMFVPEFSEAIDVNVFADNFDDGTLGYSENNSLDEMTILSDNIIRQGQCGDNAYYTLTEDGVMTIYGSGSTYAYTHYSSALFAKNNVIREVIIENGITSIGGYFFYECTNLEKVTIPNSVTQIGWLAFAYCRSIKNIVIPNSVTYLGVDAFLRCTNLSDITLSNNLTKIPSDAFRSCSSLTNIILPSSLTQIGADAFTSCTSLTNIVIPRNVAEIEHEAFWKCSELTSVVILNKNAKINNNLVLDCPKVTIYGYRPSTAETYAIENNIPFKDISEFSGTIDEIPSKGQCGENAYWELSPEGIFTVTGTGAIYDYEFNVDDLSLNEPWQNSNVKKAVIKDGITEIGNDFLMYCSELESIELPQSLKRIGDAAFANTKLNNIKIPDNVNSIGNFVFEGCQKLKEVTLPSNLTELSDGLFNYCSVKKVELPQNLRKIGSSFTHCAIEYLDIPHSVTYIESGAFFRCSIKEITIPNGVSSIESATFEDCWELEKVIITPTVININNNAFIGCQNLTIYGYLGTTAETYARENNINFKPLLMEFEPNPATLDHEPYKVIYLKSEDLTLTNIGFYCEDTSVATVDHFSYDEANGKGTVMVKAVTPGTTDLICTSNGQEVGRCTVIVKQVTSGTVAFVPDNATFSIGKTIEITADVMNDYMEKANFVIENTSIAEIVSTNKELDTQDEIDVYNIVVKGLQAGTTYLTLYEDDNIVGRCPITVTSSGVIFDPENVTVNKDNTVEINAKVTNGNTQISNFKIDDNNVAEILNTSSNLDTDECTFTIKGLNEGSTYLSYWEGDTLVGKCAIYVTVKGRRDPLIKTPEYLYPQSGSRSFYVHALKEVDGYLEPIENATLKVNVINPLNPDYNRNIGGMTDSNGICTVENVNGVDYHVTVSAEGYNSRSIPVNFKDGGRNSHSQINNLAYINYGKGFSVILTPVSSKPNIVSAVFNDNSGDNDILMHDKTIFIDNENTENCSFKVSVQLYNASRATVSLMQKGNVIATRSAPADDNGIVNVEFRDTWKNKLERYEDVSIYVESNRGQSKTIKTRLIINNQLFKSNKDVEKFELSWNKGNGSVQIPSDVVGFGGMNVSLDLPDIPADLLVSEDNGNVFLTFGMGAFDSKKESKDDYIDRISKEWESAVANYNALVGFSDGQAVTGMLTNKVGGSFKFKGCGKGKIGSDGSVAIDVQFMMSYKFSAEYPQQFIIGVVPVYLNIGLTAGSSYKPSLKVDFNITDFGNTINVKPMWGTLTMEIGASLHGGVGIAKVLSIGGSVDGTLSLTTEFATLHQMLKVRAGAYLEAQALIFKWTMPITEKTWTLYDNKNRNSYISQQDTLMASQVYNGAFTELPRNYNTESFSNRSVFFSFAPESTMYNSNGSQEIGSNVYPDAQSKIVTVNGTQYLFRLADDGSRTSLNRTVLVCSAKSGDSWGTPFIINDDGTGDYYFDICADNNNIYIAWTNCSKSFEDGATIEDVTAATNITVAVLNTLTGNVEKIGTIGRTSLGDYFPVIYVKDGAGIVAWLSNSDNNIMQTSGTNSINYSMINDNAISKYSEYFRTPNLIVSIDTGIMGGDYAIAFSCDTDENEATIDDTEIYASVFDKDPVKITDNSFVDGQVKFAELNGKGYLFWYENGDIAYTDSLGDTYSKAFNNIELFTDEFAISEDNGSIRFIWVERKNIENLDKSCVVVSEFNNSFSEPSICDITDGELSDISAYCNTDGKISYVASTKRADGVNIYDTKEREVKDIEFNGIYVDYGKAYSGEKMPVTLNIANNGNVDINELTLIVKSKNGTEPITLYDMNLNAQTNSDFTFYITVPSLSEKTSVSISSDIYNKSIDFELGYTDLAISVNKFYEGNNSYADVCITNESEIPSSAKLSIYVDGEQRFTYDIESISSYGMAALVFDIDQISNDYEEIKFEVSPYKDEVYTYNNAGSLYGKKTRLETTYTVSIPNNVAVYRNNSLLTDKALVYNGDILTIIADIPNGFNLKSITVNNVSITNGGTYIVESEDVIISVEYEHSHSLVTKYSADVGGHWHTCSNCNEKVGYEAHSEDNGVVTLQPTATSTGVKTYSCTVCGYVTRTETIPEIPPEHIHTFGIDWKSDSTSHWHECTCGMKADYADHISNNGVITVQPTAYSSGVRTYSCTVCGYVIRTETILPTGENNPPYIPPYNPPVYINPEISVVTTPTTDEENYPVLDDDFVNDDITVSLKCRLSNLSGKKAHFETKKSFFSGSAVIKVTNTDSAKKASARVIDTIYGGSEHNIVYPFDISVYNAETDEKMQLRSSGYITFEIPIPDSMTDNADDINVYHISGDTAELLESSLVIADDVTKIRFKATDFSPYMFTAYSDSKVEDVSAGAGVTANSVPVDTAVPVTNGVGIPTAKLPRIMGTTGKKRRYRILRKRKLSDLLFVY